MANKVQIIRRKEQPSQNSSFDYSEMGRANSFDDYDVNIIDLCDENLWRNRENNGTLLEYDNHIRSLGVNYLNSSTFLVIQLPSNLLFKYQYYSNSYHQNKLLKDDFRLFKNIIGYFTKDVDDNNFVYEITKTIIKNKQIEADFSLKFNSLWQGKTFSESSNKTTTVQCHNLIITTLKLSSEEDYDDFIAQIGILNEDNEEVPEWIDEYLAFDDGIQLENINQSNTIIATEEKKISAAEEKLAENRRYKSILYTSGEKLVEVIFDIISKSFGIDMSDFKDIGDSDFEFEYKGKYYIGEIKGVKKNVRSEYVGQLEKHYTFFIDKHPDIGEEQIRKVLIINYDLEHAPDDREQIHEQQISLAEKYGSLIIPTPVLLKIYERFTAGFLTRNKIEELFSETGVINEDSIV